MERKLIRGGRWAAAALALAAAGCASNRDAGDDKRSEGSTADTVYQEGTWRDGGTGTGGAGDPPIDPGAPDTAGIYGDPNRWPTGPLPSDTGVGGAGDPMPDPEHIDTLDLGVPESPEGRIPPDDGSGPDIF